MNYDTCLWLLVLRTKTAEAGKNQNIRLEDSKRYAFLKLGGRWCSTVTNEEIRLSLRNCFAPNNNFLYGGFFAYGYQCSLSIEIIFDELTAGSPETCPLTILNEFLIGYHSEQYLTLTSSFHLSRALHSFSFKDQLEFLNHRFQHDLKCL